MRTIWMAALALLGTLGSTPVAYAQTETVRRAPPRIVVTPRRPSATPYPLPGAAFPGPGYVRACTSWLEQDPRPSGTVIVPRMSCSWVRGRA